jgi:hypothetical protein
VLPDEREHAGLVISNQNDRSGFACHGVTIGCGASIRPAGGCVRRLEYGTR